MDRLLNIFESQKALAIRMHKIEVMNGVSSEFETVGPLDLNDVLDQHRLRNAAWRIVEEYAELFNSIAMLNPREDRLEELSDVFHFLVEFSILAGFSPSVFLDEHDFSLPAQDCLDELIGAGRKYISTIPSYHVWILFISSLGMCVNNLCNRPWKTPDKFKPTNRTAFMMDLKMVWLNFSRICCILGVDADKLFEIYYAKNTKNYQRIQNSNP